MKSTRVSGVSLHGVATVARQEFRLRIRAGRWRWLLGVWVVVVTAFAMLLRLALGSVGATDGGRPAGPPLFGGTMLFVLGVALLVVPALTAQSVNGDRERGTLATLQVTRLSPAEIALGKLAAAWGTALTFLALTLPIVFWAGLEGGLPARNVAVTLAVVGLLLGVVCALAQALSALLARSITSALLSYLTVFALTVGTLIAFGLATALTTETRTVTVEEPIWDTGQPQFDEQGRPVDPDRIETSTYQNSQARPDRVWGLLAPNPFVVLADAAPRLPPRRDPRTGARLAEPLDPLGELGDSVREGRREPADHVSYGVSYGPLVQDRPEPGPVWPWGLGFDVLLGAGAVLVTVRRLRTPAHRLPRGVRVA